jgi:hypothetical protein
MAKYYGSPWGTMKGKLNGSVGGGWKGINWCRVLTFPTQRGTLFLYQEMKAGHIPPERFSFPQFNLRRLATGPLGYVARMNLSTFIYLIWEPFVQKHQFLMTGSNMFIKRNSANMLNSMPDKTAEFDPATNSPDLLVLQMSDGDMESTEEFTSAVYNTANGNLTVAWNTGKYTNGADSDLAYLVILKKPIVESYGVSGTWEPALYLYGPFQPAGTLRSDGVGATIPALLPIGLTAADLTAFVFFKDAAGIIGFSKSQSVQVTAP